jgi:hypothetical protein
VRHPAPNRDDEPFLLVHLDAVRVVELRAALAVGEDLVSDEIDQVEELVGDGRVLGGGERSMDERAAAVGGRPQRHGRRSIRERGGRRREVGPAIRAVAAEADALELQKRDDRRVDVHEIEGANHGRLRDERRGDGAPRRRARRRKRDARRLAARVFGAEGDDAGRSVVGDARGRAGEAGRRPRRRG